MEFYFEAKRLVARRLNGGERFAMAARGKWTRKWVYGGRKHQKLLTGHQEANGGGCLLIQKTRNASKGYNCSTRQRAPPLSERAQH